jgi:hypothetical protein
MNKFWVLAWDDAGAICSGDPPENGILGVFSSLEKAEEAKKETVGKLVFPNTRRFWETTFKENWLYVEEFNLDEVQYA